MGSSAAVHLGRQCSADKVGKGVLNEDAAAAYLGISRQILKRLRDAGHSPTYFTVSDKWNAKKMYAVVELDRWLSEGWQELARKGTPKRPKKYGLGKTC